MITYQEIFKHVKNVKDEQILQKKARSQERSNYIFLKCTSKVSEYAIAEFVSEALLIKIIKR